MAGVKSVVVPKLGDKQSVVRDFVDHAVLFVDPSGPIASQTMFKGLRFANAFKRLAFGFFNQLVDSVENLFIGLLPVQIVFPGVLGEDEFHSRSSFSWPPPCSSSATDSSKRRAFFGARRRYAVSCSAS